ncbi:hypothetical protein MSS2_04761 [Mycobacterium marinum]|nr:hypothetical protein MSS2_04761 [Mycobacterium marinum]
MNQHDLGICGNCGHPVREHNYGDDLPGPCGYPGCDCQANT